MYRSDQPTCDNAMKWRTHQAVGAARENNMAGTESMQPSTSVIHSRDPPGMAAFQASSMAAGHCTANSTANVRCVLNVSAVTTA